MVDLCKCSFFANGNLKVCNLGIGQIPFFYGKRQ
uniref:Uncharacterized protein n=1 Tax=Manihot esculenta TaxID=3983 RepID=A0A2C9U5M7_MANES